MISYNLEFVRQCHSKEREVEAGSFSSSLRHSARLGEVRLPTPRIRSPVNMNLMSENISNHEAQFSKVDTRKLERRICAEAVKKCRRTKKARRELQKVFQLRDSNKSGTLSGPEFWSTLVSGSTRVINANALAN